MTVQYYAPNPSVLKQDFISTPPHPSSWKNVEVPHPLLVLEKDFGSPTPCPSKELDSCVEGLGVGGELHKLRAMLFNFLEIKICC